MADPQTTNLQLFTPANGADPGTWDVPVNANWNQIEAVLTGAPSVTLSNLPVTLSAAQYNASQITFSGTLTGNVTITFPTFARNWTLFNNCGSAVTFSVTCKTSVSTIFVALPPGEPIQVFSDGTNLRFMGLGRVGQYLDIGSTSVPVWITASTPAPYLNCDGTSFSSATYPNLRDYLGTTTLPDSKGRFRATLNQGTTRLTGLSSTNGLDGSTLLAAGGNQAIGQTNIPSYTLTGGTGATVNVYAVNGGNATAAGGVDINAAVFNGSNNQVSNISVPSGGSNAGYAPPSYIGGLTLIRAG